MLAYKRILLKLSGEALMGKKMHGIDEDRLMEYASQIKEASDQGVEIGIVIGGGNIFRGMSGEKAGFHRIKGDYMGMLATVINALAIQSALESLGGKCTVLTAIEMSPVGDRYTPKRVKKAFENDEVILFSFGTGNPYFTTDTAAALRAVEIDADVLLKGTRVDGVYTADPEKDAKATKFDSLSFNETYSRGLKIMDLTAITMCSENNMPVVVFDMNKEGNLLRLLKGEKIGTLVNNG
ncbi:MAG: UMP kinase [Bacteroidales bacterium]|nr:UMP kinase [Bacteroidales bacterium]